jgi:hypothetical protein
MMSPQILGAFVPECEKTLPLAMSALCVFLESLSSGEVVVRPGPEVPAMDHTAEALLRQLYQADSWHLPGQQLPLRMEAAGKAARWLYAAAMCYADRSIHAATLEQMLQVIPSGGADAATHYSMDLVLRHLPALHDLATALAPADLLTQRLAEQAQQWPLSGVGIPQLKQPEISVLQSDTGLWRLYLDRCQAQASPAAQVEPGVISAAKDRLGMHPALARKWVAHWTVSADPTR